jgi:hypothetical protein
MSPVGHRLIAFDAFGTLFSPRAPIAQQYALVTKKFLNKFEPNKFNSSRLKRSQALEPATIEIAFKHCKIINIETQSSHL